MRARNRIRPRPPARHRPRLVAGTVAIACAALVLGCAPPESQRVQGGGPGADINNRSPIVEMHAGSVIYPDERCAIQGEECTGPLPASGRPGSVSVSEHVLEPMGRGGALRRVIYEPPPDLALPRPEEIEPPFPGPGAEDG
jgi:hypothetical protein